MNYLINTITSWDEPPRARHQVAQAIAKNNEVYFIARNEFGIPKLAWNAINPNLTVIKPYFPVDYRIRYRIPVINEIYQNWLFRNLSYSFKKPRVINFDHTATQIFKHFNNVVYYCNDFHIRYYYLPLIKHYFEICERAVAEKSLFCVATAPFLTERLMRFNKNTFEIKLGAPDIGFYPDYKKADKIRLGLVGFMDSERIPIDLIAKLSVRKDIEIHLFGGISDKFKKVVSKYRNIFMHGVLRGDELYRELQYVDVGIAPYSIDSINPGGTPNKLWLYLALGKPVVVTNLPSIKKWDFEDRFVYKANGDSEFVECVLRAYRNDNAEAMHKRIIYARENTWSNRIDELLHLYDQLT